MQVGNHPAVAARLQPLELRPQAVEEQRLDHLQDVLLRRVVRAGRAALRRLHHRLEQRPEDGRRDRRPVEAARVEQRPAHRRVEVRDAERPREQVAVDVREAGQVFVQLRLPAVFRRVEHLEQPRQPRAEVGAVGRRPFLDEVQEDAARLEDARVVGEQAEDRADQEQLQVTPAVARRLQRVVQPRDQLRRLDVDRVLVAEGAALHAEDEAEPLDVRRQVGQGEAGLLALVPVEQLERPEVAEQLVAGAVAFGQRVEVGARLPAGRVQAAPGALLLDQQHAGPEQVDEAVRGVEPPDVFFVARDGAPPDAEDLEEVVVETLRLALLVGGVGPLAREPGGPRADLVPGQPHRRRPAVKSSATVSCRRALAERGVLPTCAGWTTLRRRPRDRLEP